MFGLDSVKNYFSRSGNFKHFTIIFVVAVIFLMAAIYIYRRYILPKVKRAYVANNEFVQESAEKTSDNAELYFFYTVWCPHCKKSMPVWQNLKDDLNGKEIKGTTINFIEIDCDKDATLAEKFNIQGYPTIKLVKGNQVIEYDAKPDKDTLMEFLNTSL